MKTVMAAKQKNVCFIGTTTHEVIEEVDCGKIIGWFTRMCASLVQITSETSGAQKRKSLQTRIIRPEDRKGDTAGVPDALCRDGKLL